MIVLKEAIVEDYHFVIAPGYFAITREGEELVMLSRADAEDIVRWAFNETQTNCVIPVETVRSYTQITESACNYEPGDRKATQTVELKLGDSSLMGPVSDVAVVDLGKIKGAINHG